MKLGLYADTKDLQTTRPWTYTPKGYEYAEGEERVVFMLRPMTRTTVAVVQKRARAMNVAIMDADQALKGIGYDDKQNERFLRVLAAYLIESWEGVVFANPHFDAVSVESYEAGESMPCEDRYKVLLFEDDSISTEIIKAAQGFASLQIPDEAKNSERSSGGTESRTT